MVPGVSEVMIVWVYDILILYCVPRDAKFPYYVACGVSEVNIVWVYYLRVLYCVPGDA